MTADLRHVRRLGYSVSDDENLEGVFSVGAVIRDSTGSAIAALSCAVPRNRLKRSDRETLYRAVTDATQRISRRLGATAPSGPSLQAKARARKL